MRVFVGGLFHETNVFSPIPTGLADYAIAGEPGVSPESLFGYTDMIAAARAAGWSVVEGFFASAQPGGRSDAATWHELRARFAECLRAAGRVDAVLLFCHGAQVAEGEDDCEGALLADVRALIGDSVPIGMELDLHANVSDAMLARATHLLACWEYPHIDFAARAAKLVALIGETLAGAPPPHLACRRLPLAANLPTRVGPGAALVQTMAELEAGPGIAAVSLTHGFALSDTPEAGSMVWASGAREAAEAAVEMLAQRYVEAALARDAQAPLQGVADSLALVRQAMGPGGPVVLADRADNPGGGAPGDSTFLLHAVLEAGITGVGVGLFWDPAAVDAAFAAGAGARVTLPLGGRHGALSGPPLTRAFTVRSIAKAGSQRIFGHGAPQPLGRSAALETGGLTIIVNSIRQQIMSREPFELHGLDPERFALVVAKSANHFEEAFRPIARRIVYCDAPGAASEDLATFSFSRLARPCWPLDPLPPELLGALAWPR
jgi:microcystin degradation protein MlrC